MRPAVIAKRCQRASVNIPRFTEERLARVPSSTGGAVWKGNEMVASTPITFTEAVPRTSSTQFIEVDDWVVEELESDWKKLLRKITNLVRGTLKRETIRATSF
jgi:hypothetical protein